MFIKGIVFVWLAAFSPSFYGAAADVEADVLDRSALDEPLGTGGPIKGHLRADGVGLLTKIVNEGAKANGLDVIDDASSPDTEEDPNDGESEQTKFASNVMDGVQEDGGTVPVASNIHGTSRFLSSCVRGTDCCIGEGACQGATGIIGRGSCNGDYACQGVTGDIGADSCIGEGACWGATGIIGTGSCKGGVACEEVKGDIGDYSCIGDDACARATANVGNHACNYFSDACYFRGCYNDCCKTRDQCAPYDIADNMCNGEVVSLQDCTYLYKPTSMIISKPTSKPTSMPTSTPTSMPTSTPTSKPTSMLTSKPTSTPTFKPTSKPSPSSTPPPSPPTSSGTCGEGRLGNGVCADRTLCCSPSGWCGTTPAHCVSGTCGFGYRGNGVCADTALCCSPSGWCDTTPLHCGGTCGFGSRGNGLCADSSLCCSRSGWCLWNVAWLCGYDEIMYE